MILRSHDKKQFEYFNNGSNFQKSKLTQAELKRKTPKHAVIIMLLLLSKLQVLFNQLIIYSIFYTGLG